ncbi:MAG: hypothetical protein QME77_13905 [bacterium]|nr:hypothetical protein [bacterium]
MGTEAAADIARLLSTLLDEKAWFRRGLTDGRLAELTGMPLHQIVIARVEAEAQGLVERQGVGTDHAVTMLTPLGVASAHGLLPRIEEPPSEEPSGED